MIVLDASVLIAHFNKHDLHHERAVQLLIHAADQELSTSPITLAEIFVGPARIGQLDQAQTAVNQLGIRAIALPADAPMRLAQLRARTKLKLPDCCVLLAAEQSSASIATFDDRLAAEARKKAIHVQQ